MENDPPAEGPLICAECGRGTDIGSGGADSAIRRWRPRPLSSTITVDEVVGWVASPAETMKPGTLDPNPARDPRVKLPKRVREEPTRPPAEHVLSILNEIHDPLRRIMFITLEQGALRLGEAVHLRWGDVDRAGLRLRLPRSATKRDQARCVYLPEWLMEAIEETCPLEDRTPERRVFTGITEASAYQTMLRACQTAGVPHYHPHDLRHRRISIWHQSGVPARELGGAGWTLAAVDESRRVLACDARRRDRGRQAETGESRAGTEAEIIAPWLRRASPGP